MRPRRPRRFFGLGNSGLYPLKSALVSALHQYGDDPEIGVYTAEIAFAALFPQRSIPTYTWANRDELLADVGRVRGRKPNFEEVRGYYESMIEEGRTYANETLPASSQIVAVIPWLATQTKVAVDAARAKKVAPGTSAEDVARMQRTLGIPKAVAGIEKWSEDAAKALLATAAWVTKQNPAELSRLTPYQAAKKAQAWKAEVERKQAKRLEKRKKRRMALRTSAGEIVGWRVWAVGEDGLLVSPAQHTSWTCSTLEADRFEKGCVVRSAAGIHATWGPPNEEPTQASGQVVGRVRGRGEYAAGPEGWRAEVAEIDKLWVSCKEENPRQIATLLKARYQVPVIVGWPGEDC